MPTSTAFNVHVPRERVFAYLCNPRNLILANHEGPIVDQSDGPLGIGSWFVLVLDQLRVHVEYTEFHLDRRISALVRVTGRGAAGMGGTLAFVLTDVTGSQGTRVEVVADGRGGWLRWGPLVRAYQTMWARRVRTRIEASA